MNFDAFLLKSQINQLRPENSQNIDYFPDINISIEECDSLLSKDTNIEVKAYATALTMYKLNESDLKIADYSGLLIKINEFIKGRVEYESIFYKYLDTLLSKCIRETYKIMILHDLSFIAVDIKNKDTNNYLSFISVENQFSYIIYDLLSEFSSQHQDGLAIIITKYVYEFSKLDFDIKKMNNLVFDVIVNYISEKNQLDYKLDRGYKVDIKNDEQIINYLFKSNLSQTKFQILRNLVERLKKIYPKFIINLNSNEQFFITEFKESDIKLDKNAQIYKSNDPKQVNVTVTYGKFKGLNVLIKTYEAMNLSPEIEEKILNEIESYEYLIKPISELDYHFTYQGYIKSQNKISIILDIKGQNLMKFISENINNDIENFKNNLPTIIKSLIRLFTDMQNKKVFHEKLSPYSFTIDENFNLYMIDNLNSFIRLDEIMYQDNSINNFVQRPESYAAPEENEGNYLKEKSSVYSLGLIILQLMTMRNVEKFEENPSSFYGCINEEFGWVVELLKKMIVKSPDERYSFNDLIMYVKENKSETDSNSEFSHPDDL